MHVMDRQKISKSSITGYLLTAFLFLIPANAAWGQQQSTESPALFENISDSTSEDTTELRPLWGGPTSFNPSNNVVILRNSTSLHHFDLPCETCHDYQGQEANVGLNSDSTGSDVDVNQSCTLSGCHEYDSVLNHPIDITPTGFVPANLSLDTSERITCLTCHNQETSNTEYDSSEERLLQIPNGSDLCSSCHSVMPGTLKQRSHWQFSSNAHLGTINPNRSSANVEHAGLLDSESEKCLSCHEEISASIAGTMSNSQHSNLSVMSNHPIGMNYSSTISHQAARYNSLSGNSQHLRLFDGNMGCGTCHSPYSGMEKDIVQDNRGSRLCFECHNL